MSSDTSDMAGQTSLLHELIMSPMVNTNRMTTAALFIMIIFEKGIAYKYKI
jgi:hypothetical protein